MTLKKHKNTLILSGSFPPPPPFLNYTVVLNFSWKTNTRVGTSKVALFLTICNFEHQYKWELNSLWEKALYVAYGLFTRWLTSHSSLIAAVNWTLRALHFLLCRTTCCRYWAFVVFKIIIEARKRWRTAFKGRRNEEKRKSETARSKSKDQYKLNNCYMYCYLSMINDQIFCMYP